VGYNPSGVKYAYLSQWMGSFNSNEHVKGSLSLDQYAGKKFELVRLSNDKTEFSGVIAKRTAKNIVETTSSEFPIKNFSNADVWECNFSEFSDTGTFVIAVEGMGCSYPFQISNDAYRHAFYSVSKAIFTQRQGVVKELEGGKIYPRGHHPDDTPVYFAGTTTKANVWGWYHDAGDWDGYPRHNNVPLDLMLLYDLKPKNFKDGDIRNRFKHSDNEQWIDEGTNGIPDILDEARWLLDFERRAKDELLAKGKGTGGVPGGYIGPDAGCENRASWTDMRTSYVTEETPINTFAYSANAAYYALCLRKFQGNDNAEILDWIDESKNAYQWAAAKNGTSPDRQVAAALLYRTTGDNYYQNEYKKYFNLETHVWQRTDPSQVAAFVYSLIAGEFSGLDVSFQNTVKQKILKTADDYYVKPGSTRGFRLPFESNRSSGNGFLSTPRIQFLALAYELSLNKKYLDYIYHFANYTLGGNENNMVYVGQLGWNPDNMTFHPDSWRLLDYNSMVYTNPSLPGYVNYWGMKSGDWFAGTAWNFDSDEDWSRSSTFPSINNWPAGEWRMNNRWSIPGSEFTMDETLSQALFTYGYLCNETNGWIPNERPNISLKLDKNSTINSYYDTLNLSVSSTKDVFKVEYYYNWHYIGASTDSTNGFAYPWKPKLPSGKYLLTAKAFDINGLPTNPSAEAETTISVVKSSTGIELGNAASKLKIYPNPVFDGSFSIKKKIEGAFTYTLVNLLGKVVAHNKFKFDGVEEVTVDVSAIEGGLYLLYIKSDTSSESYKIIIN
jgi:endoglucanase